MFILTHNSLIIHENGKFLKFVLKIDVSYNLGMETNTDKAKYVYYKSEH